MIVPEERPFATNAQDARSALANEVCAFRREQGEEAEQEEQCAGHYEHTFIMGTGPTIYDARGGPAISFDPGPLERPCPVPGRRFPGRGSMQGHEKTSQERTQKPVGSDLETEIDGRMDCDAHEGHGDADTEHVGRAPEVAKRRPPVPSDEDRRAREKQQAPDNPRFP